MTHLNDDRRHSCARSAPAAAAGRKPFPDAKARVHEPRDRAFDLLHLRLEIELKPEEKTFTARTTQRFKTLLPGTSVLKLDCAELDVSSVSAGGRKLDFTNADGALRIDLVAPVADGEELEVTIAYSGKPRTGLWFVGPDAGYPKKPYQVWSQGEQEDTRYWVPTWDSPNDRATTEVLATVPARFTVISNGKLVATSEDAARKTRTFHWVQDVPHVTYLLSLVAAEMDTVETESKSGVALQYHVPKGRGAEADLTFRNTPAMMDFLEDFTGVPYPWAKYAQSVVYDFTFGGMENTSATTLTDRCLHDATAHLDYRAEPLVAHELAHQWFGDLVTCRSWEHLWLNEGFATYCEALWQEHAEGRDEFHFNLLNKADLYLKEDEESYRRAIVTKFFAEPGELFDRHAYEKASLVLHMLRTVLGTAGFKKGVKLYLERNREACVETHALRVALEDATGRNLAWFFDEWVTSAGYPELKVETYYDDATRLLEVRIAQAQDTSAASGPGSASTPVFRMPLVLRLYTKDAFRDVPIEIRAAAESVYIPCDAPPLAVTVDPGNHVLKTLTFERSVEALAVELERAELAIDRGLAARALGPLGSPRSVAVLAKALAGDPFWGVRAQAAKALGKSRIAEAYDALVAHGLSDKESRVRTAAIEALGDLKDVRAVGPLKEVLARDASYYARGEAAKSIGRLRVDGALEIIRTALAQESHSDIIRQRALDGLAELRDRKAAIPVAMEWSEYGRAPKAREAAIRALGKLGKDDPAVRDHLEAILRRDGYIWARSTAIAALGELKDEAAIPALELAALSELDSRLKREARDAIAAIRDKRAEAEGLKGEIEALREAGVRLERRITSAEALSSQERK